MVFRRSLTVHFWVVIEEIGIDLVQDPWSLQGYGLHKHEEGGRDPVNEGPCWPLMSEWEMQELKDLEEGAETVHEPMLIIFGDSSL